MSRQTTYTLREARERSGFSREQVAARLQFSSKTLERMEKANRAKRHVAAQLATLYDLPLRRLRFEAAAPRRDSTEVAA